MIRFRAAIPAVALCVAVLGGCSNSGDTSAAATEEAIVGGIETVAPEALGRTTIGVIDAIEGAGTYDCTEEGSDWQCVASDGSGGDIRVVGADDAEPTISGTAPIDADTVAAVAEVLAAAPDEVYSDDAGLVWPAP